MLGKCITYFPLTTKNLVSIGCYYHTVISDVSPNLQKCVLNCSDDKIELLFLTTALSYDISTLYCATHLKLDMWRSGKGEKVNPQSCKAQVRLLRERKHVDLFS